MLLLLYCRSLGIGRVEKHIKAQPKTNTQGKPPRVWQVSPMPEVPKFCTAAALDDQFFQQKAVQVESESERNKTKWNFEDIVKQHAKHKSTVGVNQLGKHHFYQQFKVLCLRTFCTLCRDLNSHSFLPTVSLFFFWTCIESVFVLLQTFRKIIWRKSQKEILENERPKWTSRWMCARLHLAK